MHFVARVIEDQLFVGLICLHAANTRRPELGLWIREDMHKQGYGAEAVAAVALWASRSLCLDGFEYPVAEENSASRKIAESLGDVIVGQRSTPKYDLVVYHIGARPCDSL